ncbi:MAG TPA: peptidoglycan DD-metalloendopeptidase family protein [Coleofasciculaceae cyanobacterium]
MTSTILEAYTLPLLGASNPQVPSPQTTATESSQLSTNTGITVTTEVSPPETTAVPEQTSPVVVSPGQPIDAESPAGTAPATRTSQPSDALPDPVTQPATPPPSADSSVPDGSDSPAVAPAPHSTATPQANPSAAHPPSPETSTTPDSAKLTAARQAVAARLETLVNRDRQVKASQLQQNLVTLALYYAQIGEFEDARQVAKHPALSPAVRTAVLAEIEQLAAQGISQPGQPGGTPTAANPANPTTAAPATQATGAIATTPIAGVPAEAGYSTIPATPELLQPYLSDRCLNLSNGNLPSAAAAPSARSAPTRRSPYLPIGQQVAGQIATATVAAAHAQTQPAGKPSIAKPAVFVNQTVSVSRVVPVHSTQSPAPQPSDLPQAAGNLKSSPGAAQGATAGAIALPPPDQVPPQEALRLNPPPNALPQALTPTQAQSVPTVEVMAAEPFSTLGTTLGAAIPKPLKSMFQDWLFATSSPFPVETDGDRQFSANVQPTYSNPVFSSALAASPILPEDSYRPQQIKRLQPLSQLIKLSRGATKFSDVPASQLAKSVAVSQMAAGKTSDYWRVIAANCGGFQTQNVEDSSGGSRLTSSNMIFPLPIPVPLTSGFGWRIHPITGDRRFHSGIDLGAPFGTPVLSALAGRVVSATEMGGYGLAVVVQASGIQQQNLYAHLSAIAVKPGDWVEQGSVLGLVGSTGSSTGPHLHFETLLPSAEGWTAVNPLGAATAASVAQVP